MKGAGDHDPLAAALRTVADHDRTMRSAPQVEARLRAESRRIARSRRQRLIAACLVLAASVVVAVLIGRWRLDSAGSARPAVTPPARVPEITTGFFALPYSRVPATSTQLVRLELPRSALAVFGLGSLEPAATSSPTVTADVLIGDDGLARALRFVRPVLR